MLRFNKKLVIALSMIVTLSVGIGAWFVVGSYSSELTRGEVFIMYAGSLIKTFESTIGPTFQKDTGYSYIGESKGSVQLANMIIDKQRNPDVFVSAGTIPIMKLMNNSAPLAYWLAKFASAEIVIAYTPNSPFISDLEMARTGEIPWYEVLSRDGLEFRRTDPELDPKGYYTIIAAKLANAHYNDQTIKDSILGEDRNPAQLLPEETLKTTLEQGQIDAAAAYKHEAVARGLPYVTLPREINLGDPNFSNFYNQASYTLGNGQIVRGETIDFSLTIPETNKNIGGSIAFIKFLLSEKGLDILESDGLNPIKAVAEGDVEKMPSAIKELLLIDNQ
jgi:molybdate/tungstate transport system substrate-binding protein